MKTLYIDCISGISGDMFIGALLDAGGDAGHLQSELQKLPISHEYELSWRHVRKNGIKALKFDVELMQASLGDGHSHDNDHAHGHHHAHNHEHEHEHAHGHHHDHRAYKDIVQLIEGSALADAVKRTALQIFKKIGEAEGKIHGLPLEQVHFHEVGAVDSIVDIVGAAILLHQLQILKVKCAPVPVGVGTIKIDHGIYPVPAPATLEMLKGIPLKQSSIHAELTTPTGAAIAAVLAEDFGPMPSFKVEAIGYGAGTMTFPNQPNVLRVVIGE